MPRYATIITADDGAEIVSAIGEFERAGPPRSAGRIEQVAPGVRIGMVRGGPVDAVAGFGFPLLGLDRPAIAAATAQLKAEKSSDRADQASSPKPARAKSRKKPARRAGKARKVSSTKVNSAKVSSTRASASEAVHD